VRERYDYGLKQKQAFYAREAQLGADHPAWGLNYTNDIDELSSDEGAANLPLQRIEDHALRLRHLAGLDQDLDQFLLAVGERDADGARARHP
jgi:hypothetical protein